MTSPPALDSTLDTALARILKALEELALLRPNRDEQFRSVNWLTIDLYEHCWAMLTSARNGRWSPALSLVRLVHEREACVLAAALDQAFARRYWRSGDSERVKKVRARPEDARDVIARTAQLTESERRDYLRVAGALGALLSSMHTHPSAFGAGGTVIAAVRPGEPVHVAQQLVITLTLLAGLRSALRANATYDGPIELPATTESAPAVARESIMRVLRSCADQSRVLQDLSTPAESALTNLCTTIEKQLANLRS